MIQPLRRIHRIVIPLLMLLVAAAALVSSKQPPSSTVMPTLPDELVRLNAR